MRVERKARLCSFPYEGMIGLRTKRERASRKKRALLNGRLIVTGLEVEADGQLNLTWCKDRRVVDTVGRRPQERQSAIRGGVRGQRAARSSLRAEGKERRRDIGNVLVVEEVESLGQNLKVHRFGEAESFRDTQVNGRRAWPAEAVALDEEGA